MTTAFEKFLPMFQGVHTQYRYHETLSDKVYEITNGCEVPDGYEEDHFRSHIMCEFDPRDGRFLFGWVYDSAINTLWMSIGSTWIHYEVANSLELAKKIVGSMDYLPDDLGCSQGFGYMTEQNRMGSINSPQRAPAARTLITLARPQPRYP